jgi:hypothetical protein
MTLFGLGLAGMIGAQRRRKVRQGHQPSPSS